MRQTEPSLVPMPRANCYDILSFGGRQQAPYLRLCDSGGRGKKPKHNAKRAKVSACGVGREESPEPHWYTWRILAWEKKLFEEDSETESD